MVKIYFRDGTMEPYDGLNMVSIQDGFLIIGGEDDVGIIAIAVDLVSKYVVMM